MQAILKIDKNLEFFFSSELNFITMNIKFQKLEWGISFLYQLQNTGSWLALVQSDTGAGVGASS